LRRTDTNTSYIRDVKVVINGGTLESRGLEVEASTMFMRNLNLRLIYNMAYAKTDRYGPSNWYYVFPDGSQLGNDSWHGGNNGDGGTSGNSNERWNPNHVLKLNVLANTPKDFGPAAGSFYPLGNWTLNVFTTWNSGQLYTWHAPGDFSTEVNNKRWEGRMFTNLRLAKGINLMGTRAELSLDVINLFNQHQLAQLGGSDLDNYELNGELPKYGSTGEPLEWQWYYLRLLPRKVVFGLGLEF
jgi:outer membrane receptor protein involved in Fe transport